MERNFITSIKMFLFFPWKRVNFSENMTPDILVWNYEVSSLGQWMGVLLEDEKVMKPNPSKSANNWYLLHWVKGHLWNLWEYTIAICIIWTLPSAFARILFWSKTQHRFQWSKKKQKITKSQKIKILIVCAWIPLAVFFSFTCALVFLLKCLNDHKNIIKK